MLALAGCGRVGLELSPSAAEERDPANNGSLERDASVDGEVVDAQLEPDAAADASAAAGPDARAQGNADASARADADAGAASGMRIVVDNSANSSALRDFPVRVPVDTRSLIEAGILEADCSNLRVSGGDDCGGARSFFLPEYACNDPATELWVLVPQLLAGAREVLALTFDGAGSERSDGTKVFAFFDGFDGTALDTTRWIPRGPGNVFVSDGMLRSQGIMILESVPEVVSADQSIVGMRIAASSVFNTDVELGVGTIDDSGPLVVWAYARSWDGVTFLSYDVTTHAFDGSSGTFCSQLDDGLPPAPLGGPWVDHPPSAATFLSAEFGYANQASGTTAWLRSSRGASFRYASPSGCTLPSALPVLISLDHDATDASPVQRVDYVYVRPTASNEPTASVMASSALACGSTP